MSTISAMSTLVVRLTAITTCFALTLLLASWYWAPAGDDEFAIRVARLRQSGQPVSLSDLQPKAIAEDDNAAVLLQKAYETTQEFEAEIRAKAVGDLINEQNISEVRQLLAENSTFMDILKRAATRKHYASLLDFSVAPLEFQGPMDMDGGFRSCARIMYYQAQVEYFDNRFDAALATGIRMLQLVRHYEQEPAFTSFMTALVVRRLAIRTIHDVLRSGSATPGVLQLLQHELALHDDVAAFRRAMAAERAISIELYRLYSHPQLSDMLTYLKEMDRLVEFEGSQADLEDMREFHPESQQQLRAWQRGTLPDPFSGDGYCLLSFSYKVVRQQFNAVRTEVRCLRVLAAIYQLEAEDERRESIGIDTLNLPREAIKDPYADEPLQILELDGQWMVYSVGLDGVDDGGHEDSDDIALRPKVPFR